MSQFPSIDLFEAMTTSRSLRRLKSDPSRTTSSGKWSRQVPRPHQDRTSKPGDSW